MDDTASAPAFQASSAFAKVMPPIHAIINNQPYVMRPRDLQRGLGLAIEIPRDRVLVAKLDQRRAAGDEATDLFRMRQT